MLRTTWIDRLRTRGRRPQLVAMEEPPDEPAPRPVPILSESDDREEWNELFDEEVLEAMDELPDSERMVLMYYTFGELGYREIADALECPLGTVMSRLHRARSRLRQRLVDYAARRGIIKQEDQDCEEA